MGESPKFSKWTLVHRGQYLLFLLAVWLTVFASKHNKINHQQWKCNEIYLFNAFMGFVLSWPSCLLTGGKGGDTCFHIHLIIPVLEFLFITCCMSSFLNSAHQPARCETPVCGENLPIQVFEVFGGRVWIPTTVIPYLFLQAVLFYPSCPTQNISPFNLSWKHQN